MVHGVAGAADSSINSSVWISIFIRVPRVEPLVDPHGRVLGINTSGLSRNTELTIPVSTVNRVVEQLLEKGHIGRGYLGLGMYAIPLPEELQSALALSAGSGLNRCERRAGRTRRQSRSIFG